MVDYVKCYTAEIIKYDESGEETVLSYERNFEHYPERWNLEAHMADCATEFPEFADNKAQIFITEFYDIRVF